MSLIIRPALKRDYAEIKQLLNDLDLYYPTLKFKDFWIAESDGRVVGTAQLEEFKNFFFLSSLAVAKEKQVHGIARALLNKVLKNRKKDIYLYTIMPDFFKKFDFKITDPLPALPSKERYECDYCHSEKCVTMVKSFRSQKGEGG